MSAPSPTPQPAVPAVVFLRTVLPIPAPDRDERVKVIALRRPVPPQELFARSVAEAVAFAERHRADADVYFGVTLKCGPRGGAAATARFQALWLDVDAKCFRGGSEQAFAALERLPLPPSVVVGSGHGLHAYWLLREPLAAEGAARARAVMRGLRRVLARAEGAVAPVDDVSDLARVLRMPGTYNHKSDPPRPVQVVLFRPGRRYDLMDFEEQGIGSDPADQAPGGGVGVGADGRWTWADEDGRIVEHSRNVTLTRIAGALRSRGLSPSAIEAALLAINRESCDPPLPEREVSRIARGMQRYPPGARLVLPGEESTPARRNGHHADGAQPTSPTSLPALSRPVGSEVEVGDGAPGSGSGAGLLELTGDVLAAAGQAAGGAALRSLPLLGCDGYIIEGWSHLVAGYPRSGKTELLVRCCREWLDQGRAVAYFTEEPRSIWQARLAALPGDWSNLHVVFALGADPAALMARAFGGPEDIIVVDTVRNLLRLRDETDNSEVAAVLNPWIAAARAAGRTLILAHHVRKGGGEYGEGIAGGHALLGVVDIAIELLRDGQHPDRRLLRAFARLIAPPELVYERGEDGAFRALGTPEALQRAEVKERVRAALSVEWQTTAEVHEALDEPRPGRELLRSVLLELARVGMVERDPDIRVERVQGRTVRWRLRGDGAPRSGPGPVPPHPATSLPAGPLNAGSEVDPPRAADGARDRPPPAGGAPPPPPTSLPAGPLNAGSEVATDEPAVGGDSEAHPPRPTGRTSSHLIAEAEHHGLERLGERPLPRAPGGSGSGDAPSGTGAVVQPNGPCPRCGARLDNLTCWKCRDSMCRVCGAWTGSGLRVLCFPCGVKAARAEREAEAGADEREGGTR